jgi:hypothetical protein
MVGVIVACDAERSVVTEPFGDPIFSRQFSPRGENLPNGETDVAAWSAQDVVLRNYTVRLRPTRRNTFRVINSVVDSIYFEGRLAGLDSLVGGAVYQMWLGRANGDELTNVEKFVADLTVMKIDTSFTDEGDPVPDTTTTDIVGVSSFSNGGPATQVFFSGGLSASAQEHNVVFVTIENDANATEPSTTRPLWARFPIQLDTTTLLIQTGQVVDAGADTNRFFDSLVVIGPQAAVSPTAYGPNGPFPFAFGNFEPDPADQYVFFPVGRGVATYSGGVLTIDDSALARPPEGYYYEAHMIARDERGRPWADTVTLGPLTAPYPRRNVSLFNADVEIVDEVVLTNPPSIRAAAFRFDADTSALPDALPFEGLDEIWITLENKKGRPNHASPSVILVSIIPTPVNTAED